MKCAICFEEKMGWMPRENWTIMREEKWKDIDGKVCVTCYDVTSIVDGGVLGTMAILEKLEAIEKKLGWIGMDIMQNQDLN